jgi:uncharacterized iron-regulated protein
MRRPGIGRSERFRFGFYPQIVIALFLFKDQAMPKPHPLPSDRTKAAICRTISFLLAISLCGCMREPLHRTPSVEISAPLAQGTILSAQTAKPITFEALISDLSTAQVIYVGETHTNRHHHEIQLKILKALTARLPSLSVGMEMFDRTYQGVLDRWSAGGLTEDAFLRRVHWYANWRYPFGLYRNILTFIKAHHLPLVGLNLPFCIAPKISIGGIDSLSAAEMTYLPHRIDLTDPGYRAFLRGIYSRHPFAGRDAFDYFVEAQCTWDETMAETIAAHLGSGPMLVLTGNGHIIHKFGIPNRVYARTHAPFRTVYLLDKGEPVDLTDGDYLWVTAPEDDSPPRHAKPHRKHAKEGS